MSSQSNPLYALESAELAIVLKPVYSFLTALQQPGANVQTAIAGINTLELEEAAQVPLIEAVGLNNAAAAVQAWIEAKQTAFLSGSSSQDGGSSPAPAPAPAPLVSSENGSSVL